MLYSLIGSHSRNAFGAGFVLDRRYIRPLPSAPSFRLWIEVGISSAGIDVLQFLRRVFVSGGLSDVDYVCDAPLPWTLTASCRRISVLDWIFDRVFLLNAMIIGLSRGGA